MEVPVQKVGCDIESLVAVGRHLILLRRFDAYTILTHQSANAGMPDWKAMLLFSHPWTAIAAEAETGLFLDIAKTSISVRCLWLAGRQR